MASAAVNGMRTPSLLIAAGFSMISIAACADPALRPGTPAQTTGASLQSSHTVDNAGFVDNGGRTSDEYPMGELGGARPTEGGGRAPGASPATVPLPVLGNTESSFSPGTTSPRRGDEGANDPEHDDRLTSATCDRELSCNRIGTGRTYTSKDSCSRHVEAASKQQLTCPNGVQQAALASCLKAVRLAPCGGGSAAVAALPACRASVLCAP